MSVWEVRPVLQTGDRFWENVYHIITDGDTDVSVAALEAMAEFYVTRTLNLYTVVRIVRRVLGTTDAFIEMTVDTPGAIDPGSAKPLPLFNVVKVVLNSAAGRNGLK